MTARRGGAPVEGAPVGLGRAMADGVVVLDGGLSTALEAAGHDLSDELWTARLLLEDPDAVRAAHTAFLDAGAQVVITAGYQVSFEGFARRGLTHVETAGLLRRSVRLAREAVAGVDGPRWVAASVGPYGAVLADGSEYRGRYGLSTRRLVEFHRPRIEVLAEAGVDVLAVETIPDRQEVEAVLEVVAGSGVPVWLSCSARGTSTCAGQPLEAVFADAASVPEVIAVGVNCCDPGDVEAAVVAARAAGKPAVVYPNSGERWDARARSWSGGPTDGAASARRWVEAGARLVGGCCRTGPADIAALADRLRPVPR
ncbi:homocysteine S-methyltransferase [Saccharothrix yanglingensis]|uniref:Homocysteine S-methyltransferase n=2 Tax=Saccharothrix yanglingensis TaxID=659496 RepID=A0ABU0WZ71_9PSEU|nr:homocysteine S-methyltransferase [Saccharothrix yanglingensis]